MVTVLDYVLDPAELAFRRCGALDAVSGTSARLVSPKDDVDFVPLNVAGLRVHAKAGIRQSVAKEVAAADVLVFIPVIKQHDATGISGALKKAMGVIRERRAYHTAGIHECIAEISTLIRPTLVVADATRVLQSGGPKGPGDVSRPGHVLVATDPALLDSYALRYLEHGKGLAPEKVPHIALAAKLLGSPDLRSAKILEVAQ